MHESPRLRRLRSDLAAMERLRDESSVLRFRASGKPVQQYLVVFHGLSLTRFRGRISVAERHEVEIKLGAGYPRVMPEIRWHSPIYHPNISEIGLVCLGGYGTHWVPSLNLDELCGMLWDMARFHNYDVRSPYNREAALWVAHQTTYTFPLDPRPLRDLRAALGRIEPAPHAGAGTVAEAPPRRPSTPGARASRFADFVRVFRPERPPEPPPPAAPEPPPRDGHGTAPTPEAEAEPATVADPAPAAPAPEGIVILDDPPEPRGRDDEPPAPARLRAADEEILFIE